MRWLLLLWWFCVAWPAWGAPSRTDAIALVGSLWEQPLDHGLVLDEVRVRDHEITYGIRRGETAAARVIVRHPSRGGRAVGDVAVGVWMPRSQLHRAEEQDSIEAVGRVLSVIAEADANALVGTLSVRPPGHRRFGVALPVGLVGVIWLAVLAARRGRALSIRPRFRPNHLVPAFLQITIFTYWAIYVHAVQDRVPDVLAQLVFAYGFDALLALTVFGTWRLSFAPIPVVLSTNLFVWFGSVGLQWSVIALALASKVLFRRDEGHIFNPSAMGISVVAALTLLLPGVFPWGTPTPGIPFNLPPNMAEVMLLVALVAQLRFPIVMVPLCAVIGINLCGLFQLGAPNPFWPATFLIILLFSTDPTTLPRTVAGRCCFGLFLGVGIALGAWCLRLVGHPDDYAKVLAIPLANFLAPRFDRWGARAAQGWKAWLSNPQASHWVLVLFSPLLLQAGWFMALGAGVVGGLAWWQRDARERSSWLLSPLDPRWNRAHVCVWVCVALVGISRSKAANLQVVAHFVNDTPGLVASETGFATCDDNPAFCRPFSVLSEANLWR